MDTNERALKQAACEAAVTTHVRSGMTLGLGSGSTSTLAIELIGKRLGEGALKNLTGVSTSDASTALATKLGIPLKALEETSSLDVDLDGADEVLQLSDCFALTKGLGGALLREKAVARRSKKFVVMVDESKLVEKLGTRAPLPVEVTKVDVERLTKKLTGLGGTCVLRVKDGATYVTDNDNVILDVRWANGIDDPKKLARTLDLLEEVQAHGLFIDLADEVFVAAPTGTRRLELSNRSR